MNVVFHNDFSFGFILELLEDKVYLCPAKQGYDYSVDYSRYLDHFRADEAKLLAYGFQKDGEGYRLMAKCQEDGFAFCVAYSPSRLTTDLRDTTTNENYAPFSMNYPAGSFVSGKREEANALLTKILKACFINEDYRAKLHDWITANLDASSDNPFDDHDAYTTIRVKANHKWFGLFMNVPYRKLGLQKPGDAEVLNLKLPPEEITKLIDNVHFFKAYHMNKVSWISIRLNGEIPFDQLCSLCQESFALAAQEKKKS